MKRFIIAIAVLLIPATVQAQSTVPALPNATSLIGAEMYLAQTGASNNKLGLATSVFSLSGGLLTINTGGITGSMLGFGAAASNIGSLGGDLSGSMPSPTVVGLQGRPVSAAVPAPGNFIGWNGSQWAPASSPSGSGTVNPANAGALAVYPAFGPAVSGSTLWTIPTDTLVGNLSTGGTAPVPLSGVAGLQIAGPDGPSTGPGVILDGYAVGGSFIGRRADGSKASPTVVGSGALLAGLIGQGFTGTTFSANSGLVGLYSTQTFSPTALGTEVRFYTTPDSTTTLTLAGKIANDGGIIWPATVTGGSQGAGSGNFASLFINGVAVGTSAVSLTSASPGVVLTPSTITGVGTIGLTDPANAQSGASYTIVSGDAGKSVLMTNASATTISLPVATTSGFGSGFGFTVVPSAGTTINPTTSTINGLTSLKLGNFQSTYLRSDGSNYAAAMGVPQPATQTHTTVLYDDMTWGAPSAGVGTVTNTGTLTANQLVIGNGGVDVKALGSLGTTTTVYHGNAAGAGSFGSVVLADMATQAGGTVLGNATGSTAGPTATATPILGIPGTSQGNLRLAGVTSGTVTLTTAAVAGTWSLQLPTSGGSSGQVLSTDGAGVTSWITPSVGTGTVTSVNVTVPGGLSVTGVPYTVSGTAAIAASGNTGGVFCYTSATTSASSATLASGSLVKGGGAGACPVSDANWVASGSLIGNLSTGGSAPATLGAEVGLQIVGPNGPSTGPAVYLDGYGSGGAFIGRRADGTKASPTVLVAGDLISALLSRGYDGSAFSTGSTGEVGLFSTETFSTSAHGTEIRLYTTPNGTTTLTQAGAIANDGGLVFPASVTGGSKGAGTLNAANGVFKNGVELLPFAVNSQSGASYAIVAGDAGKLVYMSNSSAVTNTIPQATGSFTDGYNTNLQAKAGTVVTPTTSTVNGAATLTLGAYQYAGLAATGGNYVVALGLPMPAAQTGATILHDNMTWGAVALGSQVSGTLPVANGGTGLTSGTSGGVVAFTATGTLASSAALTANEPMIGGGAGATPTVGSRSGNTTKFATTSGTLTSGNCAQFDASGNVIAFSGACGAGAANVQSFTSSGTYTWNSAYNVIQVYLCAGGGGGGGGARNTAGTAAGGGGGGGGGCKSQTFKGSDVGSNQTVTIGTGGGGGAAAASDNSAGSQGSVGNNSTFGSLMTAYGGGGGGAVASSFTTGGSGGDLYAVGVTASAVTNGYGGAGGTPTRATNVFAGSGGAASATADNGISGAASDRGGPGGGSGGSGTNKNGGNGGRSSGCATGGAGSTSVGVAGGSTNPDFNYHSGCGGGGGFASSTTGSAGGNGTAAGGGGGGGGALNGNAAGAGGNGGDGFAVVVSW